MSWATDSPLMLSLNGAIMQVSTESERNPSVSYFGCFPLALADNHQIQDSGLGLFANASNIPVTGGTSVSLSCELYTQLIIVHILSVRMILYLLTLEKGI